MPIKTTLGISSENTELSYAKLIERLANVDITVIGEYLNALEGIDFIEDEQEIFRGSPMSVCYAQLPAVSGSELLVKVLLLKQGDGFAFVIPKGADKVILELLENPENVVKENASFDLYADIYNLDSRDTELLNLIKSKFLSTGDSLPPYQFLDPNTPEEAAEEAESEEVDTEEDFGDFGGFDPIAPEESIESEPNTAINMESYKSFRGNTKAFKSLLESLRTNFPEAVSGNIKVSYIGDDKGVLVLRVDNKKIYNTYSKYPKKAKETMTNLGETIKRTEGVQLVDTEVKDGARYFIIADSSQYWLTEQDNLQKHESQTVVVPKNENVITLKKTNIRVEARKNVPCLTESGHLAFYKK